MVTIRNRRGRTRDFAPINLAGHANPFTVPLILANLGFARRAAITLLELMVVLGVITILMVLTFPAIQAARESARAIQCRDHLRQIGIAAHNFHSSYGRLPWSGRPLKELLPEMDGKALVEAIDNNQPIPASPAVYLCPSDNLADASQKKISYHINGGSAIDPLNGVYELRSVPTRTFRDLTDGLSSTALFSEKMVEIWPQHLIPADVARRTPLRYHWRTDVAFPAGEEQELAAWCLDATNLANAQLGLARVGADLLYIEGRYYNHMLPPNNWNFSNGDDPYKGPYPATSQHSGGVNVLMADGAVRFVSSGVDLGVWRAVGSRADGDVVGEF